MVSKTRWITCAVTWQARKGGEDWHEITGRTKKLVLPSSSFSKALSMLVSARSWTVKHYLNTYRLVPETSDSMRYAKHGDLINLKACIESGEATIFDTGPDGWSLLHVS
jgi:hypothetical protein